ncbi:MAG: IS3 family transposase [Lentihominibacter sp.]
MLDVSESGYYRFVKNLGKPSKDEALSAAIKSILDKDKYNDNYGVPRMKLMLEQRGIKVGTRRLLRVMRENG